jgi:uncharacterized hydrophobic protein (TIGR00271 family)
MDRMSARIGEWLTAGSRTPEEIRDAVYLVSGDVSAKQTRFWLLLVLSTCIATAGVVADSTATVIGAMIVAPLAVPIQGAAVAIAYGESRPLLWSAAMVAGAVAVVIGLAALIAVVLPQLYATADNSQVTSRVAPTLVDLFAAAATGLAGAFAVARRDIGDILPGVAIAISLVPPLAVVGVTAVDGSWDSAVGALLLFVTNVLAIVVVGIVLFGAMRLRHELRRQPSFRSRPVYSVIVIATLLVVGALSLATYRTVELSDWTDAAEGVAGNWALEHDERLLTVRLDGTTLVVVVQGLTDGEQDADLPRLLSGAVPSGTEVVVNRVPGQYRTVGDVGG